MSGPAKSARILIVDDDRAQRSLLETFLQARVPRRFATRIESENLNKNVTRKASQAGVSFLTLSLPWRRRACHSAYCS